MVTRSATITDAALTGSGSAAFTVTAGVSFSHLLAHFKDADPTLKPAVVVVIVPVEVVPSQLMLDW